MVPLRRQTHISTLNSTSKQLFHAETITGTEGSGLGLSIVRETAESLGGRAWAEFPENGETVFAFSLPSRRLEDAASAGTKRLEDSL